MRLLDLVKQNHGIRSAADLLCELSRLVVADVSGRRSDNSRYRMLFHKLGHIESDKRFGRMEKICGKRLYKLGLTYARRSCEYEGYRLTLVGYTCSVALDRSCYRVYRLILTDDLGFESVRKLIYLLKLVLADVGCGNSRPDLDYLGNIRFTKHHGRDIGLDLAQAFGELDLLGLDLRNILIASLCRLIVRGGISLECLSLLSESQKLLTDLLCFIQHGACEREMRRRLIEKVDRLIGQISVGYISLRESYRS